MELLLVRHAKAEDREKFALSGAPDASRPLTREGRKKMRRAAAGLTTIVPRLASIAVSPYRRAVETAEILAAAYGGLEPHSLALLAPGSAREELLAWLQAETREGVVALVGHEPDLGRFASWLLGGPGADFIPLKKGGACLLRIAPDKGAGCGTLCWLLTPSQLRALAS
jgi:phosphohistidine phosphatase